QTLADLTFDTANSTVYGTGSLDTNLYTVNPGTGATMSLGASGVTFPPNGLGLPADSVNTTFGTPNGASKDLVTYNTSTGAATVVGALSGAFYPTGSIGALAFNTLDVLYGVNVNLSSPSRSTYLITIDTSTGIVTNIGQSVDFLDAIAFSSVPETSTWLAGALTSAILVLAIFRRRIG